MSKNLGATSPNTIWEAARSGQPQQVEALVQQGTPVDARDPEGKTALMLAAMNGHTATVQLLLALRANPALVDREGLNAAQLAAQRGTRAWQSCWKRPAEKRTSRSRSAQVMSAGGGRSCPARR